LSDSKSFLEQFGRIKIKIGSQLCRLNWTRMAPSFKSYVNEQTLTSKTKRRLPPVDISISQVANMRKRDYSNLSAFDEERNV
ncbi:unnamed protein product, partial [Citrullus colocynthis]